MSPRGFGAPDWSLVAAARRGRPRLVFGRGGETRAAPIGFDWGRETRAGDSPAPRPQSQDAATYNTHSFGMMILNLRKERVRLTTGARCCLTAG